MTNLHKLKQAIFRGRKPGRQADIEKAYLEYEKSIPILDRMWWFPLASVLQLQFFLMYFIVRLWG